MEESNVFVSTFSVAPDKSYIPDFSYIIKSFITVLPAVSSCFSTGFESVTEAIYVFSSVSIFSVLSSAPEIYGILILDHELVM